MESGATYHFPPVVLHQGRKALWNRFGKKPLVNRPEERVRLKYLDYLTLECEWPGSRIAVEPAVNSTQKGSQTRADLICYDRNLNPAILIECKSEYVKLGGNAAEQVTAYNQTIGVGLLCITNGISDFWFDIKKGKPEGLSSPPTESVRNITEIRLNSNYWEERGFAGKKPIAANTFWISETLQKFWSVDHPWQSRFLDIHHKVEKLELDSYYRLAETSEGNRIAMTFVAGYDDDTYLVSFLNSDGQNRALLISNLNKASKKQNDNSVLVTGAGRYHIDIRKKIPFNFKEQTDGVVYNLPGFLEAFFHQKIGT